MAKIIELKTNYQPHKFDTQTGKYQVGQLIYYRGDMANIAGWFRITKANPPSQYMGLSYDMKELDGDRTMVQIKESMISEVDKRNGLTRFVTEKAYNKAREEYNKAREEEENRINETKRQEKSKEFFIESLKGKRN